MGDKLFLVLATDRLNTATPASKFTESTSHPEITWNEVFIVLFYGSQCKLSQVEDWTKCVGKVLSLLDVNSGWLYVRYQRYVDSSYTFYNERFTSDLIESKGNPFDQMSAELIPLICLLLF